jgi:hypothetical protein
MDITDAAAPKSDQINADDLMSGPRVVTITETRKGNAEQPVEIVTAEFGGGRPYRPGKSMIRVLINAWGAEARSYVGRRMTIYRDPEIAFGGEKVGGIRISHMSHIDKKLTLALTVTRGRRKPYIVQPLPDAPPVITDEQADEMASTIKQAANKDELDAIVAQLKTFNLGVHRGPLLELWKARLADVTTEAQQDDVESGAQTSLAEEGAVA